MAQQQAIKAYQHSMVQTDMRHQMILLHEAMLGKLNQLESSNTVYAKKMATEAQNMLSFLMGALIGNDPTNKDTKLMNVYTLIHLNLSHFIHGEPFDVHESILAIQSIT